MGRRKNRDRVASDGAGFGGSLGDLLRARGLAPAESADPVPAPPVADTAPVDDLSAAGKLVVRRTRKGRGGRTVTLIEGLDDLSDTGRAALAAAARKALGAGARVEDGVVVVQGDLGPRLADWLRERGARQVIVS